MNLLKLNLSWPQQRKLKPSYSVVKQEEKMETNIIEKEEEIH